jgi:hypothetical protein
VTCGTHARYIGITTTAAAAATTTTTTIKTSDLERELPM